MRLKTDWLIQDPIDLEHKQYVLLDYISKVNEDFENMKLYPSFQELAIHLANTGRVLDKGEIVSLKREPQEIDDEILLEDLIYNKVKSKNREVINELIDIANYSKDKLTDLFLIGKSIWSILYDSVTIKVVYNQENIKKHKTGCGFFYLTYNNRFLLYQYRIDKIQNTSAENKCYIEKIFESGIFDENIESLKSIIDTKNTFEGPIKKSVYLCPIFKINYEQKFPLEGSILSIAKRKVINYIFQTIRISELKSE